jgi:hypothetical protein
MTLEQTTWWILCAVETEDLEALEKASQERVSAMQMLASIPPTLELREAVAASIAAGEEARRAIRSIRQRARKDSRRLENIEQGFLRALLPAAHPQIDYEG